MDMNNSSVPAINKVFPKNIFPDYIIKASFKDCPIEERYKFSHSNCILPISIGQKAHENVKFEATLALINRSFKECTFLIDDTIQRYTLAIDSDKTLEELYEDTLIQGDEWLERNRVYLKTLKIPYKVIRWNDWITKISFLEKRKEIEGAAINNKDYRRSIDTTIKEFLKRYEQNKKNLIRKAMKEAINCVLNI